MAISVLVWVLLKHTILRGLILSHNNSYHNHPDGVTAIALTIRSAF